MSGRFVVGDALLNYLPSNLSVGLRARECWPGEKQKGKNDAGEAFHD
jgi:hypothetical protein